MTDEAGEKNRKRGSVAGAALRAHGKNEAERIIRMIRAELGLPKSAEELEFFRKGDSRKVLCAALVKARTSVKNDWLANRLRMGHPAVMGPSVSQTLKDPKCLKILKKHEKTYKFKD